MLVGRELGPGSDGAGGWKVVPKDGSRDHPGEVSLGLGLPLLTLMSLILSVSSQASRPDDFDLVRHHKNNCSLGFMWGRRDWK